MSNPQDENNNNNKKADGTQEIQVTSEDTGTNPEIKTNQTQNTEKKDDAEDQSGSD